MKSFAVIALLLATLHFSFAQNFEGVLEAKTTTTATKEKAEVKWFVKNGSSRIEISGVADGKNTGAVLIFQQQNNTLYLLSNIGGQDAAFPIPQDSLKAVQKSANTLAVKMEGTKKVAGYDCYFVKIQSAEGYSECWVSNAVQLSPESFPLVLRSKGIIGSLQANGIKGIPLEVISRNSAGETVFSFQITNILPQAVNDAQFQLPANVQSGEELLKKSVKAE